MRAQPYWMPGISASVLDEPAGCARCATRRWRFWVVALVFVSCLPLSAAAGFALYAASDHDIMRPLVPVVVAAVGVVALFVGTAIGFTSAQVWQQMRGPTGV
jgi:hypothetical protein